MRQEYRFLIFAVIFLISLGIVAVGLLTSYNLNKTYKRQYLQTLLYQQIFMYSFFLYGVWGRIFLGQILSGLGLTREILTRASFFIPALGLPFLVVGWFMLVKFFYETKNLKISTTAMVVYFSFYAILITLGAWFTSSGMFLKLESPENVFIRLLAGLNLVSNLYIIIPAFLLKPGIDENYNIRFNPSYVVTYLMCVFLFSVGIWFIKVHFVVAGFSILLMFATNAMVPGFMNLLLKNLPVGENTETMDFDSFCAKYEISKREAEIIREICSGKSNQDISDSLFISLQTVKDHSHRIYTKIGVKNRIHLISLVRGKIKIK